MLLLALLHCLVLAQSLPFPALYAEAEALYLKGKYADVLPVLARVAAEDRNADYFNLAGMAYAGLGDLAVASRAMLKAIDLAPDRPDLLVNLAGLYQRARDNPSALRVLTKAVSLPGATPEAHFALALTHFNLGNFDRAVEACKVAVRRKEGFSQAYLLLGRAYGRLSDTASAASALQTSVKLQPACAACWFELAQVTQPPAEAEQFYRRVIALNPRHAASHYQLGKLLASRDETPAAIEALEEAIALDPEQDGAYYQLGGLYRKIGEPEKAKQILAELRARKERKRAEAQHSLDARANHKP